MSDFLRTAPFLVLTLGVLFSLSLEGRAMGQDATKAVVEGNTALALDLYGKLRGQPGNLFFSPSSISAALAMTYAGARGETAEQMARTLHFPTDPEQVHAGFAALRQTLTPEGRKLGFRLEIANRLWGQQDYHFLPDFLALTRQAYGAELAQVDFARQTEDARVKINEWAAASTENKIRDLVPAGALTSLTRLVLTNAIYFKSAWTEPFAKRLTQDAEFHLGAGKKAQVPLMHRSHRFPFAQAEGLKLLELPYATGELSALFLLPDEVEGLEALEARLSTANLTRWRGAMARKKVMVYLPRFKVTSTFSLSDTLRSMGMILAFDPDRADFSGMSTQEKLSISAVLHKAFVDLNEEGTEAAAATAVVMLARAMVREEDPVLFRADHPFLFLIVDNRTRSILFLGRITDPRG